MSGKAIVLTDIVCGYGDISVLDGLSLSVGIGECVALLGANGSGKTTTARTISGVLKPLHGKIEILGLPANGLPPDAIARMGIAHVPEGRALFPGLTVRENLVMGAYGNGSHARKLKSELDRVIELFPWIENRLDQVAGTLSGGEQQMVAISRGLMSDPKVLILDEPSLGLAPKIVSELFGKLRLIGQQNVAMVLIEQNAAQALALADSCFVLNRGRIVYAAKADELRRDASQLHHAYLT